MRIDAIFGAIGRFAVRFRWLVVLVWIAAAFGAVTQLPSLGSVTNNNNSTFLPASAPSEHAAVLAAPLGTANLFGIPVVAARSGAPLAPADVTALAALQHQLGTVPGVSRVQDLGRSPDGQAEQLQVLAQASGGNQSQQTDLVDGLRAKIASAGLPAWPAGAPGGRYRRLSRPAEGVRQHRRQGAGFLGAVHHRAAGADLPVADAGADHARPRVHLGAHFRPAGRRGGEARAPGIPAGPVPADRPGAGRGHRLRAVPGVPGPRGTAGRAARHAGRQLSGLPQRPRQHAGRPDPRQGPGRRTRSSGR